MSTQIIYNGVDITPDITLTKCILTDSNGGKQDYCRLSFANGGKVWNEWEAQLNDTVQIKHGHSDGGVMFVNGIESNSNVFSLVLLSTPTSTKTKKSRIWRKVKLSEIISDVAKNIGFKTQFYGFKDYTYESLSQINQTDLSFMNDVCMREGYNVKIFNRTIIIFNEKTLYSAEASGVIYPDDCNSYGFYSKNLPLSAVTVKYYDTAKRRFINYTAKENGIIGGSENFIYKVDNQAQAQRYATNILNRNNNFIDCGIISLKNADGFSSGSVINLSGFKGYGGKWYIHESTFDTLKNECTFSINRIRG